MNKDTYNRIKKLRARDGDNCKICDYRMIFNVAKENKYKDFFVSVDHIVRQADGGSNDLSNLRLTHYRCNTSRHDYSARQLRRTTYYDWKIRLGLSSLFKD